MTSTINRTTFLIDGFNLYHSVREAINNSRSTDTSSMKWLDIHALCASYLHLTGRNSILQDVFYFSALATHLVPVKPDVVVRHQVFIDALKSTGVTVELGRFKEKTLYCPHCKEKIVRHEEKETDVALSLKLLELFVSDACDTVVLMTGDTDVAPAIRLIQRLYPHKHVLFAFPYNRKNKELAKLAPNSFVIAKEQYGRFQFAPQIKTPDGHILIKPPTW